MTDHNCHEHAKLRYQRQNAVFITRGVVCTVCGRKWHTRGLPNYIAINIAARVAARKAGR